MGGNITDLKASGTHTVTAKALTKFHTKTLRCTGIKRIHNLQCDASLVEKPRKKNY